MSSVASEFSQVAPFKRYVAFRTNSHIYQLSTVSGTQRYTSSFAVAAGSVLRDMGKTSYAGVDASGNVVTARKVQVLPVTETPPNYRTGYIWISDSVPSDQFIAELN